MSSVSMATRAGRVQVQAPPKRFARVRWTAQEDDLLLTLAERCLRPDGSPNWGAMYALPEARGALAGHMPPGGHTRDNSRFAAPARARCQQYKCFTQPHASCSAGP